MQPHDLPPVCRAGKKPVTGAQPAGSRPALVTPRHMRLAADLAEERARLSLQPRLGLSGVLVVAPVTLVLLVAAGGLEASLRLLDPLTTYALPVVVMISFWWEDWPGTRLRRGAGWADVLVIAVAAVALTFLGQLVASGHLNARGVLTAHPAATELAAYPATMPLAGAAFVAMLQLTLVGEGWPLRRLGRVSGGLTALALASAISVLLFETLVSTNPPPGSGYRTLSGPIAANRYGAAVLCVGAWQALFYISARGAPFQQIQRRPLRLLCAHIVVLVRGIGTYLVLAHVLGAPPDRVAAWAGCAITASVCWGLLAEGWPLDRPERHGGLPAVVIAALLAGVVFALFHAVAVHARWHFASPDDWIAYAGANAVSGAVILHVAVGHRWPLAPAKVAGT